MKNLIKMLMDKKFIKIYLLLCGVGILFSVMENVLGVSSNPEKKEDAILTKVTKSESDVKADLEFKKQCEEEIKKYGNMINDSYDSYYYRSKTKYKTRLTEALDKDYVESVKYLIEQDKVDINKNNPLLHTSNIELIRRLLKHPKIDSGQIAHSLIEKCKGINNSENIVVIKELLHHPKVNPNIQERDKTILMEACQNGRVSIVKELLNHPKIDLTVKDEHGRSVLWHIGILERDTITKMLIESIVKRGGSINEKDKNGNLVSRHYGREISKIFIDNGGDY